MACTTTSRSGRQARGRRITALLTMGIVAALLGGGVALPAPALGVAVQEDGSDAVGVTVSSDVTGPRNPSCSVAGESPAPQPPPPGPPTKYVGHAWAACSGSGWANIELYALIQTSASNTPGSWETLTSTQKDAFGTGIVHAWPEMPRGMRVGYMRTRGVARFTFEYPVQQHEVRNGCAKPGPYTITCVMWSTPSTHTV